MWAQRIVQRDKTGSCFVEEVVAYSTQLVVLALEKVCIEEAVFH